MFFKKILFVGVMVLIISILGLTISFKTNPKSFLNNKPFMEGEIKSGNLSTDYTIPVTLKDIKKLGLNTVNVPVVINIESLTDNEMSIDINSKNRAIELIKILKKNNINVVLEPYPWISNGSLSETKWKPTDTNAFFLNWKKKVLSGLIKDIAMPYGVDALIISSNMTELEYAEGYWCDTVDYVRKSYKGLVTYKTTWWYTSTSDKKSIEDYNVKLNNKLFSKLDFISIGAYFELSNKPTNTVENLVNSLSNTQVLNRNENVKQEIENFNIKWKKPIYLAELGFPKANFAALHPWDPNPSNVVNSLEQANCFEAYRRVFEKEDWLLGISIFAIGEHSEDKHYLPSDESVKVINQWYK
ncbi:glycoside hydrolase family 113 [Clostridium sp.]|uniref:glycoside hydrolase family 113 n=1 Tax=Clostridium sp. TaxID=1506 RepID=UPI003D6D5D1F